MKRDNFLLFQNNPEYPRPNTVEGTLATFSMAEDARLLRDSLKGRYPGLAFPIYRKDDFDESGDLRAGAVESV